MRSTKSTHTGYTNAPSVLHLAFLFVFSVCNMAVPLTPNFLAAFLCLPPVILRQCVASPPHVPTCPLACRQNSAATSAATSTQHPFQPSSSTSLYSSAKVPLPAPQIFERLPPGQPTLPPHTVSPPSRPPPPLLPCLPPLCGEGLTLPCSLRPPSWLHPPYCPLNPKTPHPSHL
jgi:hypothetical protein